MKPKWTVLCNIVSPESDKWVGTSWEFFDSEADATKCLERHRALGNCPMMRGYYGTLDSNHLGAAHRIILPTPEPTN